MKILILFLFLFTSSFLCLAQKFSDAPTFEKALQLAQEKQKPLLLIISFKLPDKFEGKVPDNLMLHVEEVSNVLKDNFVVFEGYYNDPPIAQIVSRLKIRSFPTYVFMHANKEVFHIENGIASSKTRYLAMLQTAISQSNEKSLSAIETEYLTKKKDTATIKRYIQSRIKNGYTDNSQLLDEYVSNLKGRDLNNYQTVLFILKAGPYANSNAYRIAKTNRTILDSIYRSEPLEVRVQLNNAIINNTLASAITTKNIVQAQAAANFARATWGRDYLGGG